MTVPNRNLIPLTILLVILGTLIGLLWPRPVHAHCEPTPITWYSPTGVKGCHVYGTGIASWWSGPGVARNDCLWPWDNCEPMTVTSLDTQRSITVTPSMYGDLYTGTSSQRIVDLDPAALKALGLWESRAQGLFRVTVQPATPSLPDTALPSSG